MTHVMVADACALLNLTATGREVEILEAVGVRLLTPKCARREVKYHLVPGADGKLASAPVDLSPLERSGLLTTFEIDGILDEYVDCCVHLQDNDAAVLALAVNQGYSLMTDDRRIKRVSIEHYPRVDVRSSLCLVRQASEWLGWTNDTTREVLHRVLIRANFLPPRSGDEDTQWYRQHTMV